MVGAAFDTSRGAMIDHDLQLALADYRMMFPGATGSGLTGTPLTNWQTEYERVKAAGLAATLITGSTMGDGSSASALKNFDQKILLRALLTRRAELDPDFDEVAFKLPEVVTRESYGVTVVTGCGW